MDLLIDQNKHHQTMQMAFIEPKKDVLMKYFLNLPPIINTKYPFKSLTNDEQLRLFQISLQAFGMTTLELDALHFEVNDIPENLNDLENICSKRTKRIIINPCNNYEYHVDFDTSWKDIRCREFEKDSKGKLVKISDSYFTKNMFSSALDNIQETNHYLIPLLRKRKDASSTH